jgi:hypothetical protein
MIVADYGHSALVRDLLPAHLPTYCAEFCLTATHKADPRAQGATATSKVLEIPPPGLRRALTSPFAIPAWPHDELSMP